MVRPLHASSEVDWQLDTWLPVSQASQCSTPVLSWVLFVYITIYHFIAKYLSMINIKYVKEESFLHNFNVELVFIGQKGAK